MIKNTVITKDTKIGEILAMNSKSEGILLGFGMHCLACPVSQQETLEEASVVHNIDLDLLLEKLNTRDNRD